MMPANRPPNVPNPSADLKAPTAVQKIATRDRSRPAVAYSREADAIRCRQYSRRSVSVRSKGISVCHPSAL
jgi:hypothetical protein